ncbi:hypothetical protein AXG93_1330s1000 [Marchantia polymorpha subsp. ruderalis]|uniref:Uncharacterized protein n=1 Tax=Marchantia polymorpha subsp. ruderalis TaxID=1480154 RepID=A0A176VUF1_MARPO|nr:hypothetical protein AXG93_1330s1000 [Marchantia polymorpha subsp. ruderalis]
MGKRTRASGKCPLLHEHSSRPKQKARKLVLPVSSTDTGRVAETRDSPSLGEDASVGVLGRTAGLPTPKARTPSDKEDGMRHRPACERRRSAWLPSKYTSMTRLRVKRLRRRRNLSSLRRTKAGRGAAIAAEEAGRPSSKESPRISAATEILDTEDDTRSEEEEVESDHCALSQKTALQLRDDAAANVQRDFEEQSAKIEAELNFERAQNCILAEELVRQTRLLEKSELARKTDEELQRRLQSRCDELRAQRAEAEL